MTSIPGVGLDETRRRTTASHPRIKKRKESTLFAFHETDTQLDPLASQARNRLLHRLGYSGIPNNRSGKEGDIGKNWDISRGFGFVKNMFFGGLWCYRSRGQEHICAVCLDKCDGDADVMILKCSHKYHSKCILPWIEAHSNCPYCRNPI